MRTDDDGQLLGSDDEVGPPMKPQVREAGLEDLDLLMAWRMETLEHVFAMPESKMPAGLRGANEQYYKTALADGSHIACFAQLDGETVGCGGVCFQMEMPSPDNPSGRCAYLMNIYTREQYRGRGVGAATDRYLIGRPGSAASPKFTWKVPRTGSPCTGASVLCR